MKNPKSQNRHTISLSDAAEQRLLALHQATGAKISTIIERLILGIKTGDK